MEYLVFSNLLLLIVILIWGYRCFNCRFRERMIVRIIDQFSVGYFKYRLKDGVVVFANKGFLEVLEFAEQPLDVVGLPLEKLFVPVDPDHFLTAGIQKKKKIEGFGYRLKTLNGKEKVIKYRGCVVKDTTTQDEIAAVFIEEITEEMREHNAAKDTLEIYEKLFQTSGDMVMIFDIFSLEIKEVNPAAEDLTGFSHSELINMRLDEILHPKDRHKLKKICRDLVFAGKSNVETVIITRSGLYKDALISLSAIVVKGGDMATAIIKDVSMYSRKKEEEAKRRRDLEEFLRGSIEREERITELRDSLKAAEMKVRSLEKKHEQDG